MKKKSTTNRINRRCLKRANYLSCKRLLERMYNHRYIECCTRGHHAQKRHTFLSQMVLYTGRIRLPSWNTPRLSHHDPISGPLWKAQSQERLNVVLLSPHSRAQQRSCSQALTEYLLNMIHSALGTVVLPEI